MKRRGMQILAVVLAFGAYVAGSLGGAPTAAAEVRSAEEVLERVRGAWGGERIHAVVRLEITSGGVTRRHVVEVWTLRDQYALLRVLEPAAEAGSGYLQIGDELWYYAPAVGSAIRLPAIALSDALFGAGPSLTDLAFDTLAEDFDATVETVDGGYLLTLVPQPDAPVVYGRLELRVTDDFEIQALVTYDQRGGVVQTATFSGIVELDGHKLPTRIVVEGASGDRTVQEIVDPECGLDLDASFFTRERLEESE